MLFRKRTDIAANNLKPVSSFACFQCSQNQFQESSLTALLQQHSCQSDGLLPMNNYRKVKALCLFSWVICSSLAVPHSCKDFHTVYQAQRTDSATTSLGRFFSGLLLPKVCFSTNSLSSWNQNVSLQHILSWFPPVAPRSPGNTSLGCSNLNT